MRVVLFALTGFGNEALKTLVKSKHQVELLVTRKENGVFPYYKEENIVKLAERLGVPYTFAKPQEIAEKIKEINPELILVTTYHRIIPATVFNLARFAINIHPSLLPKYKGATPTAWALLNVEKFTGLTAHFLSECIGGGVIILQKKIKIGKLETDGHLRKRLTLLLKVLIPKLTKTILTGKFNIAIQNILEENYFPKISEKIGVLELEDPNFINSYRALTPYPGAFLERDNHFFLVIKVSDKKFRGADYHTKNAEGNFFLKLKPVLETNEVRTANLKQEHFYLRQYVELRNFHKDVLLTGEVSLQETEKWLVQNNNVEIIGLVVRGLLLGAVILYRNKNNEVTIFTRKYVSGSGKLLLDAIVRVAKKKKFTKVWVWVLSGNKVAYNFFTKHGFKDRGIVKRVFHDKNYLGNVLEKLI